MTALRQGPFESAALTHVGLVRSRNEDNYLERPEIGLWAVTDGMGGHEAGGLASAVVVDALRRLSPPAASMDLPHVCERAIIDANAAIRAIASARGFEAIGTTVAVLLVIDGRHFCLWSGDSRIYRCRRGVIEQITRDHSEAQELIDQGLLAEADAKNWPRLNVITRAIGVFETPQVELRRGEVEPGDVFVLCSDGLTAHVENEEIAAMVRQSPAAIACADLIRLTLRRGARDNVTVVVVRFSPDEQNVSRPAGGMNGAPER
jgi:serine/threonine protein phosphatase PrpC